MDLNWHVGKRIKQIYTLTTSKTGKHYLLYGLTTIGIWQLLSFKFYHYGFAPIQRLFLHLVILIFARYWLLNVFKLVVILLKIIKCISLS